MKQGRLTDHAGNSGHKPLVVDRNGFGIRPKYKVRCDNRVHTTSNDGAGRIRFSKVDSDDGHAGLTATPFAEQVTNGIAEGWNGNAKLNLTGACGKP